MEADVCCGHPRKEQPKEQEEDEEKVQDALIYKSRDNKKTF